MEQERVTTRGRRFRRVVSAVAGTAAAVLLLAGTASASTAAPSFRAQELAAGLSAQQASSLQAEVDRDIAKSGGVQTGPDQIALPGGWTLAVAIPGEAHPRQFNGIHPATPADACPYEDLCIYMQENFVGSVAFGTQYNLRECHDYPIGWDTTGSWKNNQTTGTVPTITYLDGFRRPLAAAPSSQAVWDWSQYKDIKPC